MQAKCQGSYDLGNVEGKTWHVMMALVETLKMRRERRLLLLQHPKLVKHCGQCEGKARRGEGLCLVLSGRRG